MNTSEKKAWVLAIILGSLGVVASLVYNWKIIKGEAHPNISSWMVWLVITVVNFLSYKKMTQDWVKSFFPAVDLVMCFLTVILVGYYGTFIKLSKPELGCLIMGILAGICLIWFRKKKFADTLVQIQVQIGLVLGFIPTFLGVIKTPTHEPWFPWMLWTVCFILQGLIVKITWKGNLVEFLYPVNMFYFHAGILALRLLL